MRPTPAERWVLAGLAAIGVVTIGWWALALWPLPETTPGWLVRTRAVCFNTTASGLPDRSGWLLLVGQPLGMLGFLVVVWGRDLGHGLHALWRGLPGRIGLIGALLLLGAGGAGAGWRVTGAVAATTTAGNAVLPPSVDRAAPPLGLVDQNGSVVVMTGPDGGSAEEAGAPILVTFAYAHCETVCPLVVRDALEARRRNPARGLRVVIVTLDPWRDTPARLPALADHWDLRSGEHIVSGAVTEVEAVLDAWQVARTRDPRTGDLTHPALTYIVDGGRIRYQTAGDLTTLNTLIDRL